MVRIKNWLRAKILPQYGVSSKYYTISISREDLIYYKKGCIIRHMSGYSYIVESKDKNMFGELHCLKLNKLGTFIVRL